MSEPTITLAMIVKNEVDAVAQLVTQAQDWGAVDKTVLTVSEKHAAKQLSNIFKGDKNVKVYHRPWNNRFDDARNANFSKVKTTHAFWLDADDKFDFSRMGEIREALKEKDVIWMPYHYDHDENGNVIVEHWRERVIPMNKGFYWRGWVHENCLTDQSFTHTRLNIPVVHHSDHKKESEQRNHEILIEAYEATNDPRYIHYLGISYFAQKKWQQAIDTLAEYIQVGGWDEEIYRSLLRMGEAAAQLGKNDEAAQYTLQAIGLLPDYPQGYFNLADQEFQQDNWKQCLEWLKVAFSKPQPETASIIDPTVPDKARLMGAICEYKLGNAREAEKLLETVKTVDTGDLAGIVAYEASLERAAGVLPALKKHFKDPSMLWNNLHDEIKYDNRFRKFRESVTKPKKWLPNSIVFFCGKGYEEWGPHTLDKGMGGSEEAIVYLSRELAKLGYDVHVFGEVSKKVVDEGVVWLPWTHIDKRDTFDTLVIWRYPQFVPQFKAKKILVDMHDLLPKDQIKPHKGVTYLFKSQWHKDQYPQITNFNVIGNGIKEKY